MRRVEGNVSECSQKKGGSEVNVDSELQRCGWYCSCVGGILNGGVVIATAMVLVAVMLV